MEVGRTETGIVSLEADHPGFSDPVYRRRRDEIARLAMDHREGEPPPHIDYDETETGCWRVLFGELRRLYPTHACAEYNAILESFDFAPDVIPQLSDMERILRARTGFGIRPVAGLVSPRDFLGLLARRIFPATQYIRHHSVPHYTPEPDVVHELLGHVPMLAHPEFADLSQAIGASSVGATDEQIEQLTRLYWFTVEFGLVRQRGRLRAYGAGLLSSYGELERAVSGEIEVAPLDAAEAAAHEYPITTYQPLLWEVPSIGEAFRRVAEHTARWR